MQAPPYDLVAKPDIAGIKDLKGKLISLGGPKDITRIYVERMLAPNGVKREAYTFADHRTNIVAGLNDYAKAMNDIGLDVARGRTIHSVAGPGSRLR